MNYWEENRQSGRSDGATTWRDVSIMRNTDFSVRFQFDLEYHVPQQPALLTIIDHPKNIRAPTPWYVIRNTQTPMTFFSPTVLQLSPLKLTQGDSFNLHYQIVVHPGDSRGDHP